MYTLLGFLLWTGRSFVNFHEIIMYFVVTFIKTNTVDSNEHVILLIKSSIDNDLESADYLLL